LTTALLSKLTNQIRWLNHSKNGGRTVLVDKHYSGQLSKAVHPCWMIRGVDNPQVGKTTMNRFMCMEFLRKKLYENRIYQGMIRLMISPSKFAKKETILTSEAVRWTKFQENPWPEKSYATEPFNMKKINKQL